MEYSIFSLLLILVFLIVTYYYIRLLRNVYYLFDGSYNNVKYLKTINYEVCILLVFMMLTLLFFIFNSV